MSAQMRVIVHIALRYRIKLEWVWPKASQVWLDGVIRRATGVHVREHGLACHAVYGRSVPQKGNGYF